MKHSAVAMQIAAIFLLTICTTAGEGQSNNNIIESNRAQMLVPFSQVSKDDFVIDVSEGNTEYMDGAVSIPYTNFLKDKKLRSKEEISRILRDAGVPCDRPIYIYGKCLPCKGGSEPAEYIYLILKSFGYQVRLLDGSLEQWAASGGRTTGTPSVKPKTNCTPTVNPEVNERGNQTRNAAGNGSKTDEGFVGTVTPQIANSNGTLSEEVPYTFEANSTPAQDLNDTKRQFENTVNDTMSMINGTQTGPGEAQVNTCDESFDDHGYTGNPAYTNFYIIDPVRNRAEFYCRYGKMLREHAEAGKQLTAREKEILDKEWESARKNKKNEVDKVSFLKLLRGVLFAKLNKQEHSLEISTPNYILGTRG